MDILVVDDDPDVVEFLNMFLANNGHSVETATSVQAALDKLSQKQPRLVFSDVQLPDRNGLELLKIVREKYPAVVVVMITGFKEADMVVESFRYGAMDCLFKPFNLEYIKSRILARIPA